MKTAMVNLGYYNPSISYSFDTVFHSKTQERIITNYNVIAGHRTLVDTLAYLFTNPELQTLAISTKKESLLQKNKPVTKTCRTV